jgi:Ca-activated chloride channel homolog
MNNSTMHPKSSIVSNWRRIAALLTSTCLAYASSAAGLLKVNDASQMELEIRDHQVQVTINNGFAQTTVQQTFYNPNPSDSEALYVLPLPEHASLSEMEIFSGEKTLRGEVVEKQKAQTIYEAEKQAGNDAGMAEKNSFQRFEFWVSRIPAQSQATVKTVYYQPLTLDTGTARYLYPLEEGGTDALAESFWTLNDQVSGDFSIHVTLKSSWPVKAIRVPGFQGTQGTDEWGNRTYHFQSQGGSLANDFVFYYQLEDNLPGRVEVIPFKASAEKEGTFMMVVTPGIDLKPLDQGADYVFVLDTSGSMQGKMHTLKQGIRKTIATFRPQDRFRIVLFNNNATELTRDWVPATAGQFTHALAKLDSIKESGGTNLYAGIKTGLSNVDDDRVTSMIIVTDGVTNTGEINPTAFAKLMQSKDIRVFGFLMGNSSNWQLMDQICSISGGFYKAVSNNDDIIGQILLAKSKVLFESMHDVRLSIKGNGIHDLSRNQFKKVFRGEQLIVFGKYTQGGPVNFEMRCSISGHDQTYSTQFNLPEVDTTHPELERLWALRKIEEIQSAKDLGIGSPVESEQAMQDIAIHYQLVTDYTSMIVLDDDAFQKHNIERRNAARTAEEHLAQSMRLQTPAQNYRVDQQQPAYQAPAPRIPRESSGGAGGGGAIHPLSVLFLLGLPVLKKFRNRKS